MLPVLRSAPSVKAITSSTVAVKWEEWREGVHVGDGPVVAYVVYLKEFGLWRKRKTVHRSTTTAILEGLEPETDYKTKVAAVREGSGGSGPKSPAMRFTTLCIGILRVPCILK